MSICENCSSAYLAGVFDSDGSLGIRKNRSRGTRSGYSYCPCASLTWLDNERTRTVFAELMMRYGGNVTVAMHNGFPNRHPTIRYLTYAQNAARLAKAMLPHMKLKNRQAVLLLNLSEIQQRNKKNTRKGIDWKVQDEIYLAIKKLAVKGPGKD